MDSPGKTAMQWQTFTEDQPASATVSSALFDAWFEALKRAPMEWEAAVFSRYNILDGTTDFYLSPRLCELAPSLPGRYFALPCAEPTRASGVTLLAGHDQANSLIDPPSSESTA
jgi:hypothetical protein